MPDDSVPAAALTLLRSRKGVRTGSPAQEAVRGRRVSTLTGLGSRAPGPGSRPPGLTVPSTAFPWAASSRPPGRVSQATGTCRSPRPPPESVLPAVCACPQPVGPTQPTFAQRPSGSGPHASLHFPAAACASAMVFTSVHLFVEGLVHLCLLH